MTWVSEADVRRAIDFPSSGAPISDADILEFIKDAQDEICKIYHTRFGYQESTGTATSATDNTLTDAGIGWTADEYIGMVVHLTGGTGSGQYRHITDNTTEVLTVEPDWATNPDTDTTFEIVDLGYYNEVADGNGLKEWFTRNQPVVNLISLTVNSTSVTPSYVKLYTDESKLVLGTSAEVTLFDNSDYQLVDMEYAYGVTPIPRLIKRLCVVLAAIRALVAQTAGTYDDFSTVSLPGGFSGSKGEPYTNIREAVAKLQTEADSIITKKYRPFTVMG